MGGTASELLCGPLVAACGPLVAPRFVILSVGGEGVVSRLVVFSSEESEEEECDGEGGWSRGVGKEGVVSLHLTTSSGGYIHIGLDIHVCMYSMYVIAAIWLTYMYIEGPDWRGSTVDRPLLTKTIHYVYLHISSILSSLHNVLDVPRHAGRVHVEPH